MFLIGTRPLKIDDAAMQTLDDAARNMLGDVLSCLKSTSWETESLETALREFTEEKGIKFGALAQPLRAALTGRKTSPGIFDVLTVLGRDESLGRIQDQAQN
jgi:glutamyl-tRNA synthetase